MEQVIIRFNGSVLKVTDGTALCNINDLTGDILTINVTRRRKSEGALIVKGRNLSGFRNEVYATYWHKEELFQDKKPSTICEMSKAMSDIPVTDGLTVDGDGLSWKFRIRLRTVRGERADLYAACSAALQSAVEGMAPNERATWNGRLTGQQGDVLRYGIHKYIDLKERKSSGCNIPFHGMISYQSNP